MGCPQSAETQNPTSRPWSALWAPELFSRGLLSPSVKGVLPRRSPQEEPRRTGAGGKELWLLLASGGPGQADSVCYVSTVTLNPIPSPETHLSPVLFLFIFYWRIIAYRTLLFSVKPLTWISHRSPALLAPSRCPALPAGLPGNISQSDCCTKVLSRHLHPAKPKDNF